MSLLRTAGKVAVASSVHGRVQRRQNAKWAAPVQTPVSAPPVQAAPASTTEAKLGQLKQLGELRDAGVLTEAEFEVKKAMILQS
jgi:putative oligomerization/nucleic acid binding protein